MSISEISNLSYSRTANSSTSENHVVVVYEINIFSNKTNFKKSECKSITKSIDEQLLGLGFTRIMCEPIPNIENPSVYRVVARYKAVVGSNDCIYRR